MTIALGSCNHQNDPQNFWQSILKHQPNLWIWLGDNIYADTDNLDKMQAMYTNFKASPQYKNFYEKTPVIGIWDDHDFGVNDGGKEFTAKKGSRDLLFEFLSVPKSHPAWQREGAYTAYSFGKGEKKVQIILLDARYFRDNLSKNTIERSYQPNETGDILGEAQWNWLEHTLNTSDAKLHLIGCGIQMIPEDHRFEKWANFPKDQ
ncbi:MAG: alkaline phosphatase D family protein [Bacteroidota bacterium]